MSKLITGIVMEKFYNPPPGGPNRYWCYLMVQSESGDRVSVRLHQKVHDKITVGDKISFEKPWRSNKRVKDIQVLKKAEL